MSSSHIAAKAEELGFTPEDGTNAEALQRAIRRELVGLQEYDLDLDRKDRQQQLTDALSELSTEISPSRQLVPIPADVLTDLVKLAGRPGDQVGGTDPENTATIRLQESRASSRIEATKDFRNSRTFPFAGLGAVIAGLWALREPFGITDVMFLSSYGYFISAAAIFVLIALGYLVASSSQRRDERTLDYLYDPDTQERALAEVVNERNFVFHSRDFQQALKEQIFLSSLSFFFPFLPLRRRRLLGSLGSKVDLARALRDATMLGLDRFVAAGILRRVKVGVSTRYEVPVDDRPAASDAYEDADAEL
ncbi:hypothetical protein [Curtobacterium aetherium]|uniref:Uncharacterized protein n=1 Tax=Curtobacterium aetherium TaxID=2841594 RepID=A0ACD1E167_9MICO|nr:hypothetical protein [Curtobacterium sp. L6-1]QWS32606.1 hypothetical protein KM842_09915 [Curtobacterium sp. L6-1]